MCSLGRSWDWAGAGARAQLVDTYLASTKPDTKYSWVWCFTSVIPVRRR